MECLGAKLPERWWRNKEAIQHEAEAHGSLQTAAAAHGVAASTVKSGWQSLGLPKRPASVARVNLRAAPAGEVSREELMDAELRELRALVKRDRGADVLQERMVGALETLIPAKDPIYVPAKPARNTKGGYTPHEMMLDWSDLHAAEKVDLEQMNGINEYDWQVMMRRHDKIIAAILSFKEKLAYPVPRLQIAALGDMVTGNIHEELRETNEMTIMECALQLGHDGAEFIEALIPHFETIDVDGVVGNHGRNKVKPTAKNAHDNYDWMVYNILKIRLAKYPSVRVTVPKSAFHPVKMCGRWQSLLFHGDGIRSTMPGVPWGGVARRVRELERQFEPVIGPIHHFHCGHFHQWSVTDGGRVIVNGSVKGPDEYSIKQFGGGCEATQLLHIFHPTRGMVATHPLRLSDEPERASNVVPLRAAA